MPSITTWNRITPRLSGDDIEKGLEARVYDPLWLLARQWQLGEFQGEDAGSPIDARLTTQSAKIDQFKPHSTSNWHDYNASEQPLERMVEEESRPLDLREAADAGQHLVNLLGEHPAIRKSVQSAFAFKPVDIKNDQLAPSERHLIDQLIGRAIDGRRVKAVLDTAPGAESFTIDNALSSADRTLLDVALVQWRHWFESRYPDAGASSVAESWDPHRLEYRFGIRSTAAKLELKAEGYTGKHLDWYAFDLAKSDFASVLDVKTNPGDKPAPWVSLKSVKDPKQSIITQTHRVIPAPLTVPGQPASRWWEFEDRRIGFGNLDVKSTNLSTLILLEYAVAYGDDWYLIALDQAVGSWCETSNLQVTNTFGETFSIAPARSLRRRSPWTMFTVSGVENETEREFLFLSPSLPPTRLESRALETVQFRRDEMANLAWGIEQRIEQVTGKPIDRQELIDGQTREQIVESVTPVPGESPNDSTNESLPELAWQLGTPPPETWYPLVAVNVDGEQRLQLTRSVLSDGRLQEPPMGRLLTDIDTSAGSHVKREELEQEGGLALHRTLQVSRWMGGSRHRWRGRNRRQGAPDANSGLRFDAVEPPKTR